jgi:hypothetical protein
MVTKPTRAVAGNDQRFPANNKPHTKTLRDGILMYDSRQRFIIPETIDLPQAKAARDERSMKWRIIPDNGDLLSAVVLDASAGKVVAVRQDGEPTSRSGRWPALSALWVVIKGLARCWSPRLGGAFVQEEKAIGGSLNCRRWSLLLWPWIPRSGYRSCFGGRIRFSEE